MIDSCVKTASCSDWLVFLWVQWNRPNAKRSKNRRIISHVLVSATVWEKNLSKDTNSSFEIFQILHLKKDFTRNYQYPEENKTRWTGVQKKIKTVLIFPTSRVCHCLTITSKQRYFNLCDLPQLGTTLPLPSARDWSDDDGDDESYGWNHLIPLSFTTPHFT